MVAIPQEPMLTQPRCYVCNNQMRMQSRCSRCNRRFCTKCKPLYRNCSTCVTKFLINRHSTFWDIAVNVLVPCLFCSKPVGRGNDHEQRCGLRPARCLGCDWAGFPVFLIDHVKSKHNCFNNGKEQWLAVNLATKCNDIFVRCLNNQVFWEIVKHDPVQQQFTVSVIWVPSGDVECADYTVTVRLESVRSICEFSSCLQFTDCGFYALWISEIVFSTSLLKGFADFRNKVKYCVLLKTQSRSNV